MRSQRQNEKSQEYKSRMEEGFRGKSLDQIGDWLRTEGGIPSSSSLESSTSTPRKELAITLEETPCMEQEGYNSVMKRKLEKVVETTNDPLPTEFRHVRESERKVKDSYFHTCASLAGEGLSLEE